MQSCRPIKKSLQENKLFYSKHKGWKWKCAQMHMHTHSHTLKSSASHPFTSEQREWTFNSSITKAWSHLGSKSVLISPDHTHSCLSYFLHLRNIIGWVNPHMWHALKIALIWSYAPKMHMYVFQIQKALFDFFILPVFHQIPRVCS